MNEPVQAMAEAVEAKMASGRAWTVLGTSSSIYGEKVVPFHGSLLWGWWTTCDLGRLGRMYASA